jgi:chromosome segregation ATPase
VAALSEVKLEAAATGEPGRRLVPEEFFFLLQRIDRLDEKLALQIGELRAEMRTEVSALRGEMNALRSEMNSLRGEINSLRGEVGAALSSIRADLAGMQRSLAGTMRSANALTWACLGVMAGVLGVVIALVVKLW